MVAEKPAVLDFILNPMVQTEQKLTTMNELLGAMKFSPTTINLFKILAENNRLRKLPEVIRSYMRLMAAHRGELSCSVTTAKVAIVGVCVLVCVGVWCVHKRVCVCMHVCACARVRVCTGG